jgi:hypothetical protein
MSEEKRKILEMLAEGKISVNDAERLLAAVGEEKNDSGYVVSDSGNKGAKFLRVQVQSSGDTDKVNIKIPLQLLRSGIKLAALIPSALQDKVDGALKAKGLNFDLAKLKDGNFEQLVEHLSEVSIDVDNEKEKVRIYCE